MSTTCVSSKDLSRTLPEENDVTNLQGLMCAKDEVSGEQRIEDD